MTKKRILMCAEFHKVNSGFGRYTKEILSRLHKNPNYEIAEFASYCDDDYTSDVPWKVYPNGAKKGHKDLEIYKSNPINQFGLWRFDKVVLHFKPDIVFDIRDYWMFSYQEMSPLLNYFHWVVGPTIDSIPQKTEWLKTFSNADVVLTHTDWAADYIRNTNQKINLSSCVSDSVDSDTFKPVSWTKPYHKAKYGIPSDAIVIGAVMRNQKRKLIPELFASLRELISKTNKNIFLYLHTSYPETQGWNIPELLQEYGVYNNVLFTYFNPGSKQAFCSLYKGAKIPSPDGNGFCIFPNVIDGLTNEQLSEIYNLFDIYVQYAICEGLGIPQLEAASCGVPLFAVNYSGMSEIIQKIEGIPVEYVLSKEIETGSNRATPFNNDLVAKILNWISLSRKEKINLSKKTRQLLIENYSWDKTADILTKVFDSLTPKNLWNTPMTTSTAPVPNNLSNRDFVNFIVDHILCEPRLKNTYFVQNLIRYLDESFDMANMSSTNQPKENVVKSLETFLNNKIYCEKVRSGQIDISKEDFLNR